MSTGPPYLSPEKPVCRSRTIVRTGHGATDWFKIGKGVHQGCILSPWLFNLCRVHHAKCWAGWSTSWNQDSVQLSLVAWSCLTLWDPMDHGIPGLPVHNQLSEFTQIHMHRVSDAIQPSHPLSSLSFAPNPSQHQGLFKWVSSSHQVAKILEFQLQHQSFQWIFRTDFL